MPFTPSHSEEHLPSRLTAAVGMELARASASSSVMIAHDERALQLAVPFFTHAILLDRAFAHCPRFLTTTPVGVRAVSQSQCG